jgi:hypothetical protein
MKTPFVTPSVAMLFSANVFLSACSVIQHDHAQDKRVLADDLGPAEALAHQLAQKDLVCSSLKTDELSAKNAEGAPLGPIWSNFTIQVSGCGKTKTYKIQCETESMCFNAKG